MTTRILTVPGTFINILYNKIARSNRPKKLIGFRDIEDIQM